MHNMKKITLATAVAVLTLTSANAAVNLDFESGTPGWTFETEAGATGTPTYTTAAGTGATPTTSGLINSSNNSAPAGFDSPDGLSVPGGYLLNSGGTALDATQSISGSFDYQFGTTNNYIGGTFLMGNITSADGLTGAAGQFVGAAMGRNTFGNRTFVIDGSGDRTGSTGAIDIRDALVWRTVTFTWTPTSGTTGNFEYTMTNQRSGATNTVSRTGLALASNEVFFAFGSAPSSGDITSDSYFDNINITGTAVPEPGTFALLSGCLALTSIMLRRRRD